jgi:membrane protein implicated in regulation of membrane protease activity
MREFFSTHYVSFSAILWLAGVAVQVSGFVNPLLAYILWGIASGWLIWAVISFRKARKRSGLTKEKTQSKSAVGGFIGKAKNVKIRDCHSEGKIRVRGKPEDMDVGGFIGQSENTEVVDSSAEAEIEYKQDKE